jgi:hypothetical protein
MNKPLRFIEIKSLVDFDYLKRWINRHPKVRETREAKYFVDAGVLLFINMFPEIMDNSVRDEIDADNSLKNAKECTHKRIQTFLIECANKNEKREERFKNLLLGWQEKYPKIIETDVGKRVYETKSLFSPSIQKLRKVSLEYHPIYQNESSVDYIERIECIVEAGVEYALITAYHEMFNIKPILREYEDIS